MRAGMASSAAAGEKDVKQRAYDEKAAGELFKKLNDDVAKEKAKKVEAANVLAKVKVDPAHVALLADQLDLPAAEAKTLLQSNGGAPDAAIKAYLGLE